MHDGEGEPIGRLLVLREVTSHREAERLARINSAVLEATRDGILLVNTAGSVEVVNHAYEELLDDMLPPRGAYETVWERAAAFADYMRDRDAYLRPLRAIEDDPDYRGEDEFELLSGRWVKRYTTPVYAGDGQLVGRLFVLRETTVEREAEQMKSDLVATVSHELRTPLAGVLGFAELLVTRELDPETSHQYLRTIHNEAFRLTGLINDFLDLQRIEAGGLTLSIEPLELGALLRRAVALLQRAERPAHDRARARHGALRSPPTRTESSSSWATSSRTRSGTPRGRTGRRLRRPRERGAARVSVTDRGIGIPFADQRNVFKKFFRVDSSDTREIGGPARARALPRDRRDPRRPDRVRERRRKGIDLLVRAAGGSRPRRRRGARVRSWWRTRGLRRRARRAPDRRGLLVEIVATGEDALASIRRNPPALVCLDMVLAGELDGWQVLSELKRERSTAGVPVIICPAERARPRVGARRLRVPRQAVLPRAAPRCDRADPPRQPRAGPRRRRRRERPPARGGDTPGERPPLR